MKGILCAQFSAIKVSCSFERAINQIVSFESGQCRNSNSCFDRLALVQNQKFKRMNAKHIECKFAMMGARFKVSVAPAQRGSSDYAVDIQKDRRGDFFELRVPEPMRQSLDLEVLQTDSRDRHLLLFVRLKEKPAARFLCGHDEREWFVAAVPGAA